MERLASPELGAWRDLVDVTLERRLVGAIDRLAALPVLDGTVQRVLTLCDDPDASTAELVAAIEHDPAFAANLLRYANSAALARPVRAKTVRQAVMIVGRRTLRRLALESVIFRLLERVPGNRPAVHGQMHFHAIAVATAADAAAGLAHVHGDDPHLAGLLHDVGKLVLPLAFGADAVDPIALEAPAGALRARREREVLGIDHALAGALVAERWGCSPEVTEAIALHHGGPTGLAVPGPVAACVALANGVADLLTGAQPDPQLLDVALERLALPHAALDAVGVHAAVPRPAVVAAHLDQRVADAAALARTDDLTGLSTRRHWLACIHEALQERGRGAVVLCAVEGLGAVTRAQGYGAANLLLTEVARIVGRHGHAGRIGGVVVGLWVDGDRPAAQGVAARIGREVAAATAEDGAPPLHLAMGVAAAPDDGADFTALLEAADARLAQHRLAQGTGMRRVA
jgi:putative nucleotidyltransferase with HDIG domain